MPVSTPAAPAVQDRYHRQIPFNFDPTQAPVATYDQLTLAEPAFVGNVVTWDVIRPQGASEQDRAVLWDFVLFGDGGAFVDRIVTPVFRALAYEITNKGSKGVEPAMRVTYDDANESFVLPQNISRILKDIGACASTPLWALLLRSLLPHDRLPSGNSNSFTHYEAAHTCRRGCAAATHVHSLFKSFSRWAMSGRRAEPLRILNNLSFMGCTSHR